jgi:predicted esterase
MEIPGQISAEIKKQALKTKALVTLYYGRAPQYTYFDGHSQGGRQGLKIAQEFPELYDGYLIAEPALNIRCLGRPLCTRRS